MVRPDRQTGELSGDADDGGAVKDVNAADYLSEDSKCCHFRRHLMDSWKKNGR